MLRKRLRLLTDNKGYLQENRLAHSSEEARKEISDSIWCVPLPEFTRNPKTELSTEHGLQERMGKRP